MSIITRTVYRQLLRVLRLAQTEGIPVTGCVGLPECHILCPLEYVKLQTRNSFVVDGEVLGGFSGSWDNPLTSLTHTAQHADAFQALRMLPRQIAVLQASEDESRQVSMPCALSDNDRLLTHTHTHGLQTACVSRRLLMCTHRLCGSGVSCSSIGAGTHPSQLCSS